MKLTQVLNTEWENLCEHGKQFLLSKGGLIVGVAISLFAIAADVRDDSKTGIEPEMSMQLGSPFVVMKDGSKLELKALLEETEELVELGLMTELGSSSTRHLFLNQSAIQKRIQTLETKLECKPEAKLVVPASLNIENRSGQALKVTSLKFALAIWQGPEVKFVEGSSVYEPEFEVPDFGQKSIWDNKAIELEGLDLITTWQRLVKLHKALEKHQSPCEKNAFATFFSSLIKCNRDTSILGSPSHLARCMTENRSPFLLVAEAKTLSGKTLWTELDLSEKSKCWRRGVQKHHISW